MVNGGWSEVDPESIAQQVIDPAGMSDVMGSYLLNSFGM